MYMGYFGRGDEMFFEDLEIDTRNDRYDVRGMEPRYKVRYDQRYDDRFDRRPSNDMQYRGERRQGFEPSRGAVVYRQRDRSHAPESQKNGLPFAKAIIKLYEQLEKAEQTYQSFMSEYDIDVVNIRKYAKPEIVSELWILKVAGKRNSKLVLAGGESVPMEGEIQENFEDMKQKLVRSLEGVLQSNVRQLNPVHTDAAKRLQRKVETANEQIVELLEGAPQTRENCNSLLNEIDLLKHLVNPRDEKNKVFKSNSQGESDRGNNNEGSGYQSGSDEGYVGEQAQESQQAAVAQASGPNW